MSIRQLQKRLQIPAADYLLIGDGSGSNWNLECGWATTLIDCNSFERQLFYGAMSHGTNNVGEIMAYLQPLMWLVYNRKEDLAGARVHIVTDSQYVTNTINVKTEYKKNRELWVAIQSTLRRGFYLQAHWVPREKLELNYLADRLAGMCRRQMQGLTSAVLAGTELTQLTPEES